MGVSAGTDPSQTISGDMYALLTFSLAFDEVIVEFGRSGMETELSILPLFILGGSRRR